MSQADFIISDQTGISLLTDLTNSLQALATLSAGAISPDAVTPTPLPTYSYQLWYDTTAGLLKIRNSANNAWVTIGPFADSTQAAMYVGNVARLTVNSAGDVSATGSGALKIHVGTTAERPASPVAGQFRYNTTLAQFEGYNGTAWGAIGGGGNPTVATFNGTGSQVDFTLPIAPGSINNTLVYVSGVYQNKATYSVSGTTLTFSAAPPSGSGNIQVVIGQSLSIGTPSDGTVSNPKIVDGAVSYAKVQNVSAGRVLGRWSDSGAGTIQELAISVNGTIGETQIYVAPLVNGASGIKAVDPSSREVAIFRTGTSYSYLGVTGLVGGIYSSDNLALIADGTGEIKFSVGGFLAASINTIGAMQFNVVPPTSGGAGVSVNDGTNSLELSRTGASYSFAGVSGPAGVLYSANKLALIADTSGTITMSAGGSVQAEVTSSGLKVGTALLATPSSSAPLFAARAWVNFNGTGTVAIRSSGNVTSITDNGVGDYTVNFTTAMPDANYATVATGPHNNGAQVNNVFGVNANDPPSTSKVRLSHYLNSGGLNDPLYANVIIVR